MFCGRSPNRIAGEYPGNADRLQRCLAFGQFLSRMQENEEEAQFGMYGTAAALELLSLHGSALSFRAIPSDRIPSSAKTWAREFLKTWNFADLAVHKLAETENTKFWDQSRNTLRVCNLLRGIAAASQRLSDFADTQKRIKAECVDIGNDLGNNFSEEAIKEIGTILQKRLLEARTVSTNILGGVGTDADAITFRFACRAKGITKNHREWLFIWSAVIVALVRAYKQGALNENQVYEICAPSDISHLVRVLSDHEIYGDAPYRLYALWALDHLNCNRYRGLSGSAPATTSDEAGIPRQLAFSSDECNWLAKEIGGTAESILHSEVGLSDVHSSYQVIFQDRNVSEKYIDINDHFVIPVVPVLLDLVSRYKPSWLFRPRLRPLLRRWIEQSNKRDADMNIGLLPHQNGDYNGTVNAIYYHEAALKIYNALNTIKKRAWLYVPLWFLRDELRITPARVISGIIIGLGVLGLWLYGASSKFIFVIIGSVVLPLFINLITPTILSWLNKSSPGK